MTKLDKLGGKAYTEITYGTVCEEELAVILWLNKTFLRREGTHADVSGHIKLQQITAYPKGEVCTVKVLEGLVSNKQATLTYVRNQ